MKKISLIVTFVALFFSVTAQTPAKYFVQFTDKNNSPYSVSHPEAFLSPRALEKRTRFNIAITETDLPVNEQYIAQVLALDSSNVLFTKTKWHNGITIYSTSDSILSLLQTLPFVKFAERTITIKAPENRYQSAYYQSYGNNFATKTDKIEELDYGKSKAQIFINNAQWLHRLGFRGEGILLMELDGGFHNIDTVRHFRNLRSEGRLWGIRNFIQPDVNPLRDKASHGTSVLSCFASELAGELIGTAPKVSVFLALTEDDRSENKIEEDNWVAGIEWADSLGCDVLNSSLGYTNYDDAEKSYTAADLNGTVSRASRAATMGAERGIISCISAGNSGNDAWTYIGTPADAENVLATGGIDIHGKRARFSSYNVENAVRVKPDAATVGVNVWVATPYSKTTTSNGTSFASPLLAGMVSCLWQAFPQRSNLEVMEAVRQSCSNAKAPDTSLGYGIADMFKAYNLLLNDLNPNAALTVAIDDFVLAHKPFALTLSTKEKTVVEISLTQKSTGYSFKKKFQLKVGKNTLKIKNFSKLSTALDFEFLELKIAAPTETYTYLLGLEK